MILVDSSIWIDHLRRGDTRLSRILEDEQVLTHPFVIGELACGHLSNREELLDLLRALPSCEVATDSEAHHLVESHGLAGRGLGWVDVHLLAGTVLAGGLLWTRDRQLNRTAVDLGVAFPP